MAKKRKTKKKGMGWMGKTLIVLTIGFGMGIGATLFVAKSVYNFTEDVVASIIEEI